MADEEEMVTEGLTLPSTKPSRLPFLFLMLDNIFLSDI